ncbi:MAG: zinc-ribbon domain-containing protein [Desulfuromonadales bacterium]|nr:zinc-ribbon domain-containing protein [Desulfuromonadales bacterium]MBN2792899.1 zinc-ribbon domain-containing protein [Desulfuromonadales bacterium]
MIEITCPHCGFSKQIDPGQLPPDVKRAHCPKCRQTFSLQPGAEVSASTVPQTPPTPSRLEREDSRQSAAKDLPKAGFWVRTVATVIDAFIVFMLQFVLGSLLALMGFAATGSQEGDVGNVLMLIQIFGYILSFAYYIVFTGYCGQTPGKMAVRIKVIRCDGSQISYGRAAFREIPAKFISGIIFGIGYLMVAFDEQKQGLHDRLADTYVIKL